MRSTIRWRPSSERVSKTVIKDEAKLLSALGLCARARKMTFGVPMICEAMRSGERNAPKLVFEASDTSDNTHKRLSDRCRYYGVRLVRLTADSDTLSQMVGKRSTVAAVAVCDADFCRLTEQYIDFGQSDQILNSTK